MSALWEQLLNSGIFLRSVKRTLLIFSKRFPNWGPGPHRGPQRHCRRPPEITFSLYYFKSDIFDCLKKIKRGKGNEYQLTDAIQKLIEDGKKVVAIPVNASDIEIDVGTVESYKYAQEISYKKA